MSTRSPVVIGGREQAPCPICDTAEQLDEVTYWADTDADVLLVQCADCLTSAPVGVWNRLPRLTLDGGGR